MRFLAAGGLLALAACQPSPAMVQLQGACDAGDMRACESVLAHQRGAAEFWASRPVPVAEVPAFTPLQAPQRTNCQVLGNHLTCTTF